MKHPSFKDMYEEVEKHPDYRAELAMLDFSEDVLDAMRTQSVTRAELARRLGTSPGHVTRLLSGSGNLTLATMTRMAFALGLELHTSLLPRAAAQTAAVRRTRRVTLPAQSEESRRRGLRHPPAASAGSPEAILLAVCALQRDRHGPRRGDAAV